ncbi:MAG TPA: hypothetical protein VMO26_10395 [Vicinamibacterales bacterium]|nr:hypothetical protein [Vicinamibacterales bacterium]
MDGPEKEFDREELLALVRELRGEVQALRDENRRLRAELTASRKPTPRLEESYSLQAEERREVLRPAPASTSFFFWPEPTRRPTRIWATA